MSVYTSTYGPTYGAGGFPLDLQLALRLGGAWEDVTQYAYNRTTPAFTIQRGRQDETAQVSPSSMTGQLNNRDGRFTSRNPVGPYYGQLGRNTPVRLSVPARYAAMRIEDDAVSYAETVMTAVTGDIDVRLEMDLSGWSAAALISDWQNWALVLNGDGTLGWWIDQSGTVTAVTSAMPVPVGHVAVRVTRNHTSGVVTFWTSDTISGVWAQLGAAVTSVTGALGSGTTDLIIGYSGNVAADINPVFGTDFGGPTGRFYAAMVLSGIGGTAAADPDFTAQSEGTTIFADAAGNTWELQGTAEISLRSYRYHGEMSSLPVAWDPSGHDIWVPFTSGGLLRRLQQGTSPVSSAMRRAITALGGAKAYWPAEDGTGAAQIASGLPGGPPMTLNGTPTFQNQPGAPSADQVFACSAALPEIGASAWTGYVPAYTSSGQDAVTFLITIPQALAGATHLLTVSFHSGDDLTLHYTTAAGGSLFIFQDGVNIATGPTGVNGQALLCQLSNLVGSTTANLWVLPVGTAAVENFYAGTTAAAGRVTAVTVNQGLAACGDTEIGHILVTATSPDLQATFGDPLNAWAGETAGNRFARICGENGVAPRVYGYPDTTQAMGAQPIDTLTNILQSCEDADRGMLYEPAECLGIGYRTLASLCNQVPAVTLDYSAAEVGDQENSPVSLTSVDDDQYTRNDITLTRESGNVTGSSYQAQLDDGSAMSVSPPESGGVGDYASSTDVNTQTDAQLPDLAEWMVHIGTVSEERYPQVVTGLHRMPIIEAGLGFAIQDVRIGDYVAVENTPSWLPPGDIRQVVAGVTETLTSFLFQVSWNAIPESPYETAVSDDEILGRADTDGSTLHTSVSSTATSLSVATTNSGSPLWTTDDSGGPGLGLLIPMYAYPSGGGATFWGDVTAAAPTTGVVIGNPGSGPGSTVDSNYAAVFAAAQAAGITVAGYVYTNYGARSAADVETDIAGWAALYGITDIFLDEVATAAGDLAYYEGLISYIRAAERTATIVLNPGTIPDQGYFGLGADVICVCEDAYANLATDASAAPSWLFGYPPSMISVVVNQCSTGGNMATALGLAQSAFNAGYVWVTSDSVYGAEPSYFATEVADAAAAAGTGDFPFSIVMGGEQITVTGITGSSSPQAFTVVRSVNGVVKAHSAGEDVRLFYPPVLALI